MASLDGSFYNWITKQNNRDDGIGNLSCEIIKDKLFPKQSNSLDDMTNYLLMANAFPMQVKLLSRAYKEFKVSQNKRKSISKSLRFKVLKASNYRCQISGAVKYG